MEEAPGGTPVGVDDPYDHVERCDHLTDDGRCRMAVERPSDDPAFARARRDDDPSYGCPVVDPGSEWTWSDCPHFRSRATDRECERCGLAERRMAHDDERPLLEEHHLSYDDEQSLGHEITVYLCRWCHAKVHGAWARVGDDVNPDPEAIAEKEQRRSRELDEAAFRPASERFDDG